MSRETKHEVVPIVLATFTLFVAFVGLLSWHGCSSAPPPGPVTDGSGDSDEPIFTLYANPEIPLIVSMPTEDGGEITLHGDKDIDGVATSITAMSFQEPGQIGTDQATWIQFDQQGRILSITDDDGTIIEMDWQSDTVANITATAAGGGLSVSAMAILEEDGQSVTAKASATSRVLAAEGIDQRAFMDKSPVRMQAGESTLNINVISCDAPATEVRSVNVKMNMGQQLVPSIMAFPNASFPGQFSVSLPVQEPLVSGERLEAICKGGAGAMGELCNLVQGHEVVYCVPLGLALDAATVPSGKAVAIAALCEKLAVATIAYCNTVGKGFGPTGTPTSAADFICDHIKEIKDYSFQSYAGNVQITACATARGGDERCTTTIVSRTGPYPDMTIDFGSEPPIGSDSTFNIRKIYTVPAVPTPSEGYTVYVRLHCASLQNVAITAEGPAGELASTSLSAPIDVDSVVSLVVPGQETTATHNIITVDVGSEGLLGLHSILVVTLAQECPNGFAFDNRTGDCRDFAGCTPQRSFRWDDGTCHDEAEPQEPDPQDPDPDELCADTCQWANDGVCDDGGEGAESTACELGTDCLDCGSRTSETPTNELCSYTCQWSGDGVCDDGGTGSEYDGCELGTDCDDCGPRTEEDSRCDNSGGGGSVSGTYPAEPFNSMQIQYSVTGVTAGEPEDTRDFTTSRRYDGVLGGSELTISGTAISDREHSTDTDFGSFPAMLDVTVRVGDQTETFHDETDPNEGSWTSGFSVTVPIPLIAETGSFSIVLTYVNPRNGDRVLEVTGDLTCTAP